MTITSVVDTYIAAWNEGDAERRRALVGGAWTEDGTYLDPLMQGSGPDQIAAMIGAAQAQFPGHRFELSFGPDAHNDVVRFAWTLTAGNGPVARGTDFATVAEDGRLRSVTGFLETV
ncbi:nuclear transport factor 2 family protein [Solirubrobacter sp. CPCC 204708]|uniref:Nuclear transport factor 2 family protein n=1 Tax=Solirubrobacter deserti TaxID=2282478 RepID=A0ABT4RS64_9ACTN|nr:nuclear transport factor 2 family protein [Solirubrobacter deserti]MBE2319899.1 nuclear transport factor 2 family protein [Solirubrobacter deserti]MDA0141431.1 nuclear transport factor 2 family protein [Solirubrobacter deserti]